MDTVIVIRVLSAVCGGLGTVLLLMEYQSPNGANLLSATLFIVAALMGLMIAEGVSNSDGGE